MQYVWFNDALLKVAVRANQVFGTDFEERKTHWHGWRHGTPCNMLEMEPKPTMLEVCLWSDCSKPTGGKEWLRVACPTVIHRVHAISREALDSMSGLPMGLPRAR